jgi:hypothetical protein
MRAGFQSLFPACQTIEVGQAIVLCGLSTNPKVVLGRQD